MISDGAATMDVQNVTGVTAVSAKAIGAAVDVDTKANATSVTITGTATTVDVDDNGTAATTADKLAKVSITGATGAITIDSDALTTLELTTTGGSATVTAAAATRELTVNTKGVTAGILTDATATTVTVNNAGANSVLTGITAATATDMNIGTTGYTLNAGAITAVNVATLDISGDKLVTIASQSLKADAVITSTNTAGVTMSTALGTTQTFKGAAGKDTISIGATTKAITMGAGDDIVTMTSAVGTGGSVDAGEGTDTLSMTAANATIFSGGTTFEAGISNFEKVLIGQVATGVTDTINMANLDDINYLVTAGTAGTGVLNVTNIASNGTVELTGVINAASSVAVKDASANGLDVLNIKLNGTSNIVNVAALTVGSVETINITATDINDDTTTLLNPAAASTILLAAADATTINVSGNHGVDFTGSTLTKVTTLDASGVVSVGNAAGATATQIATTGAVTFTSVVSDKAVTVTTGNGADVIDVSSINGAAGVSATFLATNVTATTVTTGEGNDIITGSAGKDIINAGAGNDTITGGAKGDTLTGGAGNDKFVIALATDSTLAAKDIITDFQANTYGQGTNGASTVAGANATATNWTGDVIDLTFATPTNIELLVVSNAADAQTFIQNAFSSATYAAVNIALDSTTGNLYIDTDNNGTIDSVLQLTGVTTITEAAFVI